MRNRHMHSSLRKGVPAEEGNTSRMASDNWENDGVSYTIDASEGSGATITARRTAERMTYTRVIPKQVSRKEAEKLFVAHLARPF